MDTGRIETKEASILEVLREIEGTNRPAAEEAEAKSTPAPKPLLDSLKKKRELLNLLGGYVGGQDIEAMKSKLGEAITDLEEILKISTQEA